MELVIRPRSGWRGITILNIGGPKWMFAATRFHSPGATVAAPAGKESQCSQLQFGTPDYPITNPRFFLPGFYTTTGGANPSEFAAPNAIVIDGLSIKVGSSWYRATFSGANSTVIDPATNEIGVLTDSIPCGTIPSGSTCLVRTAFTVAAGASFIGGMTSVTANSEAQDGAASSLAAKLTDNSAMSNTSGVGATNVYGPMYMVAQGGDGRKVGVIVGDSISRGKNEPDALGGSRGVVGWCARGLDDNVSSRRLAYGHLGVPGVKPQDWNSRSNWARRLTSVGPLVLPNRPFDFVLSQMGTNSVAFTDYRVNLRASQVGYFQVLQNEFPGTPIVQGELLPRPSSSDVYVTLANQTFADDSNAYFAGSADTVYAAHPKASRWLFNLDVGGTDGLGDATAYFRANGYITDSMAPWRYVSYDLTTNRDKWSLRSFTTTLAAAYTANALSCSMTAAPTVGEAVCIDPGTNKIVAVVTSVTGTGPFTVGLSAGGAATASGASVTSMMPADATGLHPGTIAHIAASQAVIDWKNARGM